MAVVESAHRASLPDGMAVSVAAQLCWHAFRICQAMAASLDRLQDDLAEISGHCDALIEMALELDRQSADADPSPQGVGR